MDNNNTKKSTKALANTKPGSTHSVNFHCSECNRKLICAVDIFRIFQNAVWARRIEYLNVEISKESEIHPYKSDLQTGRKQDCFRVYCACGAWVGHFLPEYKDTESGQTVEYKFVFINRTNGENLMTWSGSVKNHIFLNSSIPAARKWIPQKRDTERQVLKTIGAENENDNNRDLQHTRKAMIQMKMAEVVCNNKKLKEENEELKEGQLCSICCSNPKSTALECGHVFCNPCIVDWRKTHNTCPVCQQIVQEENDRKIYP